ncbi:MAG: hypothetical protein RAP03_05955, partial [Candidatus Electryonea clarkiae]|nr:hypothetical protein [Candidatus Electryonea clarkiae]
TLVIAGKDTIPRPLGPTWTQAFYLIQDKRAVVIWDQSLSSIHAWFFKDSSAAWYFLDADSIRFGAMDIYFGKAALDKPMLRPDNFDYTIQSLVTPDSVILQFSCLDKSFALIRHFTLDFYKNEITQDYTTDLTFGGGHPEHSLYFRGEVTDSGRTVGGTGMAFWRPANRAWEWKTVDPDANVNFMPEKHDWFYNYNIGQVTPVADSTSCNTFVLLDPCTHILYRFHTGYGKTSKSGPYLDALYPLGDTFDELADSMVWHDLAGHPGSIGMNKRPLETDREGRLWVAPQKQGKLIVLKEAFFENTSGKTTWTEIDQVVSVPSQLWEWSNGIIAIDGSISGYITVTSIGGIETYQVIEN